MLKVRMESICSETLERALVRGEMRSLVGFFRMALTSCQQTEEQKARFKKLYFSLLRQATIMYW